jgi:hypothetical protein
MLRELSALTGEAPETAVAVAVEKRLRDEKGKREGMTKAERMREFARNFATGLDKTLRSEDHATMLYDENGLPK